jgi:hypothetical protein
MTREDVRDAREISYQAFAGGRWLASEGRRPAEDHAEEGNAPQAQLAIPALGAVEAVVSRWRRIRWL